MLKEVACQIKPHDSELTLLGFHSSPFCRGLAQRSSGATANIEPRNGLRRSCSQELKDIQLQFALVAITPLEFTLPIHAAIGDDRRFEQVWCGE